MRMPSRCATTATSCTQRSTHQLHVNPRKLIDGLALQVHPA
jgi:hypothetical protein